MSRKYTARRCASGWKKGFLAAMILAFSAGLLGGAGEAEAELTEQMLSELTDTLLHHEDRAVREAAAQALGRIGGDVAYAALDKAGFLDWPMWRYDAARSANTPLVLADELHLQWVRELPEPKRAWRHQWDDQGKLDFDVSYSPVVLGERVFVPSMVTDSLTAYHIDNGEELWRYYADGPVRVAPVAWRDKVYFISDDGHLYCLDAETGEEQWRFQGGPSDHRLLGNERIINFWAARGGPVIKDGVLYFAAGIWPMHGVFIYALDAETGAVEWVNDTTGSDYVQLPHGGATGFGSIAPQGYIAADEESLVVAGGRTPPAFLNRETGAVEHVALRAKPAGGYAVSAEGEGAQINTALLERVEALADEIDGVVFNKLAAHGRLFVTTEDGRLYCFGSEEAEPVRHLHSPAPLRPRSADWAATAQRVLDELGETDGYALILGAGSGDLLREVLMRSDLHVVVAEADAAEALALRNELADAGVYGRRAAVIQAEPASFTAQPYLFSLVLSEDAGAAGIEPDTPVLARLLNTLRPYGGVAYLAASREAAGTLSQAALAADVDGVSLVDREALVLAAAETAHETSSCVWTEAALAADVDGLSVKRRDEFSGTGAVAEADRSTLADAASAADVDGLSVKSREDFLGLTSRYDAADGRGALSDAAAAAGVDQVSVLGRGAYFGLTSRQGPAHAPARFIEASLTGLRSAGINPEPARQTDDDFLFAVRGGPLTGAGQWTHQYSDPSNTNFSPDDRTKAPLGILWFGGPCNSNILPRHTHGPVPQVAGGRIILPGVETVSARCVYTGREIWETEFPGIGHPFTDLDKEERYQDGESVFMTTGTGLGANQLGSPFVTLPDAVYVRYMTRIHELAPDSGEVVNEFQLPVNAERKGKPDWGHLSVWNDLIITTVDPQVFDHEDYAEAFESMADIKGRDWDATSSNRLVVMDRGSGGVLWEREAEIGFRHNAIVTGGGRLFIIDGLSEEAFERLQRRGEVPDEAALIALDPDTGETQWTVDSGVFGTWLGYSEEYDVLVQGGRQGGLHQLGDEPADRVAAFRGADGSLLWETSTDSYYGPLAIRHDRVYLAPSARSGQGWALDLNTGETIMRKQPATGESARWTYARRYGCNTQNVSEHLITFRSGAAAFFDLENDSGTGFFGGFRSGCTNNLVVADGVVNAPDFTRTCTCSYQHQTSLALVHMPEMSGIEAWTTYDGAMPDPNGYGINFGAPGRRVDGSGLVWHEEEGSYRRHASFITEPNGGIDWVASSGYEGNGSLTIYDLHEDEYTVRLHFAEPGDGVEAGQRVFDVLIDGDEVLTGFDIAGEAGGAGRVVVKEFTVASGMTMDVELRAAEDSEHEPVISGIEVRRQGGELAAASR